MSEKKEKEIQKDKIVYYFVKWEIPIPLKVENGFYVFPKKFKCDFILK